MITRNNFFLTLIVGLSIAIGYLFGKKDSFAPAASEIAISEAAGAKESFFPNRYPIAIDKPTMRVKKKLFLVIIYSISSFTWSKDTPAFLKNSKPVVSLYSFE